MGKYHCQLNLLHSTLFLKGDIYFDHPEHIFQPETLKEAVNTRIIWLDIILITSFFGAFRTTFRIKITLDYRQKIRNNA